MQALLIALLMAALLRAQPTPLAADGSWVLEGESNMCALLHSYGTDKARVTLGIRPWPLQEQADILIFQKSDDPYVERGVATITADGAPEPITADYFSYGLKGRDQRLATITIAGKAIEKLGHAKSLAIQIGKHAPVVILPPASEKAFAALATCEGTLLESLHVEPGANARVATAAKPIGDKATWFTSNDYPSGALGGHQEGNTRILLTIGTDGRIAACTSFGTAGSAEMDRAACSIITQRGRYKPALDQAGQAIVSYQTETIRWTIG